MEQIPKSSTEELHDIEKHTGTRVNMQVELARKWFGFGEGRLPDDMFMQWTREHAKDFGDLVHGDAVEKGGADSLLARYEKGDDAEKLKVLEEVEQTLYTGAEVREESEEM
ncbi:MAG: hypothetical protein Q7S15_00235 [bacterium]|nr:hypothetical protein [bacterium]